MWQHLNKSLLQFFLVLAFFASGCLCLFSAESPLMEEEVATWSQEKLIQAVLIYEKALIEMEILISEDETSLILREIELQERSVMLDQREIDLNERDALLILQENLLETLISNNKKQYAEGFRDGGTVGSILFTILAGIIVYNITD